MPPQAGSTAAPWGVEIMHLLVGINHMGCLGLDISAQASLGARNIAVAHQYDLVAIEKYNPMHHISAIIYPRQHYVAHFKFGRPLQDDALLATDDERQHAVAIDRQRYAYAIINQADSLFYYVVIFHPFTISPLHSFAAASSGRHSR